MMRIELFLTDIMQILFMDWIENSIANIRREVAPSEFFSAEIQQFFFKNARWPIMFFLRQRKFSSFGVA